MTTRPVRIELLAQHEELRLEARAFAEAEIAPHAGDIDREERLPAELVAALGRHGYLGSRLDRTHGGRGLDYVGYGLLHRELGRVCSSTRSLVTVHDMVAGSIARLGNAELRAAWLPLLATGRAIGAFALTEPEAGSDASSVRAAATRDGNEYVLTGCKQWISFAQIADLFLVVARTGESAGGFVIPRETPGLSISPTGGLLGLRGSMTAEVRFEECRIPVANRLGPERMPTGLVTATALQLGRYGVAWGCVGLGDACWEASSAYAVERRQFGVPLVEHQLVLRMLTDMATNLRAAELLCLDAGSALERRDPTATEATLMAKYYASRVATAVASDAVQIHGALGCSGALPIERHFRDARVLEIIEGSTQIQQITIGRLLVPHAHAGAPSTVGGAGP